MMTLLIILLALAFISGSPLFTIMLGAAALGAVSLPREFSSEFDGMVEHMLNVGLGDQVQVMSTIPLFIYAGYLLAESGTADRLVRFANAALGWVPGGLAIVTIGTCALFTVFTGASGVTIIALGGVLMPALVRQGYPERFSMGLIAGTGSVGLLFPPALPLFIYGTVYGLTNLDPEIWDTRRFLFAGIVPGIVLVGMLSAVAVTVAVAKKLPRQKFNLRELGVSLALAFPELCIPFGVIIGLAIGFDLPQVAALTVVYTLVLEIGVSRLLGRLGVAWGKPLEPRVLWTTSREAMAMVGAIFIIIFASTALTNFMVFVQTGGRNIVDPQCGFRVYPVGPLLEIMERQPWMRGYDFDSEAAVRLCWRGINPINIAVPVRYFRPEEGGVSHFRYWRDNVILFCMHWRLLAESLLRMPFLIVRRLNRRLAGR